MAYIYFFFKRLYNLKIPYDICVRASKYLIVHIEKPECVHQLYLRVRFNRSKQTYAYYLNGIFFDGVFLVVEASTRAPGCLANDQLQIIINHFLKIDDWQFNYHHNRGIILNAWQTPHARVHDIKHHRVYITKRSCDYRTRIFGRLSEYVWKSRRKCTSSLKSWSVKENH